MTGIQFHGIPPLLRSISTGCKSFKSLKQSKLPDKQMKVLIVAWNVRTRSSICRLKPILQSVAQQVEAQYRKHDCQTRVGCQMGRYQ